MMGYSDLLVPIVELVVSAVNGIVCVDVLPLADDDDVEPLPVPINPLLTFSSMFNITSIKTKTFHNPCVV